MTFTFRPAVREQTPLLVGIAGPSSSGKTFSALRMATGLAGGKPIAVIDTEANRALHYADQFEFLHAPFQPPFSPARYVEAIQAAVKAGAGAIIVDSTSHLHEGPGGVLEMHEQALDRMAGQDWGKRERVKFAAWIEPKKQVNRFVNTALQVPVHMIFCFRAKDKLVLVKNDKGKQEAISAGWQPIITDRFEYEMTVMLVLPPGSRGVPDLNAAGMKFQDQHRPFFPPGRQIDEETGQRLAAWAAGGTPRSQSAPYALQTAKGPRPYRTINAFVTACLDLIGRVNADQLAGLKAANVADLNNLMQSADPAEVEAAERIFAAITDRELTLAEQAI